MESRVIAVIVIENGVIFLLTVMLSIAVLETMSVVVLVVVVAA